MTNAAVDPSPSLRDHPRMSRSVTIEANWDDEAAVWLAASKNVPGLAVEADAWPAMIDEVRLVLPELLELSGFKAEQRLDLAGV